VPRLARPAVGEEHGYTLIELLVAALLGLAIVGAAVPLFISGIRSEPRVSSRAADVQQARTTMERITREVRQGWSLPTATASELSILTYVKATSCGGESGSTAIACRVTYSCSAGTCTRMVRNPDGSGSAPATPVVTGLADMPVFTYAPDATTPTYVGITLGFPAGDDEDSITLEDGVTLRNPNPEAPPA
jgi:type II secretory pathway pseudopilin PulG